MLFIVSTCSVAIAGVLRDALPAHMRMGVEGTHKRTLAERRGYVPPASVAELATRIEGNKERVRAAGYATDPLKPDDFFKFVPIYLGGPVPGARATATTGDACFGNITLSTAWDGADGAVLTLELGGKTSLLCTSTLLVATGGDVAVEEYLVSGSHTVRYGGLSNTSREDIAAHGVRVFSFNTTVLADVVSFYDTLMLFLRGLLPVGPPAVPPAEAAANVQFLRDHMGIEMAPRAAVQPLPVDEAEVHSGDFLGILRLDGLDPMIAWGMGARLGHTAIALRENGTLYVAESQTVSHYWPVDGIQRTPWADWLRLAALASYNVVWLPLRPAARAAFDEGKANAFFHTVKGVSYGFANFLFGWIDGPGNLPPPLSAQLAMVGFALFDRVAHDLAEVFWNQALNRRLGTKGLDCASAYAEADRRGITFEALVSEPEQDAWRYVLPESSDPVTPHPSMVCNVFVCSVLKAAGMFGSMADAIQCTETTGRDIYVLDVYDPAPQRPAACVAADPGNPHCQLVGDYAMQLADAGTVAAYPHMREHCVGVAPNYYWANRTC